MSDGQQEAVYDQFTTGPPLAYQATGGADWQSRQGWGYRPLNKAALAVRYRRLAHDLNQDAIATAALGMGRGRYPERSKKLLEWSQEARRWAEGIESEVAAEAEREGE